MAPEMGNRKINPKWDALLAPSQRELLTKPGFGITPKLPYLAEEDVREIMNIIEESIKQLDLKIENDFKKEPGQ